jgi:nicotinamidase/pyrazinamidase
MANDKKRALIVVDVQNDFCPGGTLTVEHGDEVVGPLNKLMEEFLERGEPVFKSRDWHPPQTKHFSEYGGTWPIHCVQNTHGAEFHPELLDDRHIRVISKGLGDEDSYSAFDKTDLDLQLRHLGVNEVWVGGLATDYCVKNTVFDALRNGYKVKALRDAMRAVELHPGDGEQAIKEMRAAGAEIVTTLQQPQFTFSDPVVEAYLKGIDRTLLRDNLRLTVTERFERLMSLQQFADDLRAASKHSTHS